MKVTVHYYGLLAERLAKTSEEVKIQFNTDEFNLRTYFENRNPELEGISYQIAVNQELTEIVNSKTTIKEISLLPPFAGG